MWCSVVDGMCMIYIYICIFARLLLSSNGDRTVNIYS